MKEPEFSFKNYDQERERERLHQSLFPILEGLARSFGCHKALLLLKQGPLLRGVLALGVPQLLAEGLEVPLRNIGDPLVTAFFTGNPQEVTQVKEDRRMTQAAKDILLDLGFHGLVVAPLTGTALEAQGVVVLRREGPVLPTDLEALRPFTNQAGTLIEQVETSQRIRAGGEAHAIERDWLWWMVNTVSDPVLVTDAENAMILLNQKAEALFRSGVDDSPGKTHAIAMNNFLFSAALSGWNLGHADQSRELTLVDPVEGSEINFEVITVVATNYRLGTKGRVSLLKNVTDLHQMTKELESNLQRLQAADAESRVERDRLDLILRNVPNPIIVIDSSNRVVQMNPAAARLFKAERHTGKDERQGEAALRNDARFAAFISQLALDAEGHKSGEITVTDPETEEVVEMAVTTTEIRDQVGAVIATVSVMQDIGRLHELERRRLEQVLFDSEKLAATGRLAASIAHEINNPLESIQNALYLLVQDSDTADPKAKFLKIAVQETERMARILRQMLGFYRPGIVMVKTDLNALIQEAQLLVHKRLRDKHVTLVNELAPELMPVAISPDQIKQVILNLLLNAADAMPEGGGTITVRTQLGPGGVAGAEDSVQIQVKDNGTGIAEEHLANLFQPFFSTKGEKGTGLGLWVSSGIVQNHGGSLQVKSKVGRGTTFTITLPLSRPATELLA